MLDIALDDVSDIGQQWRDFRAGGGNSDQQCLVTVDLAVLPPPFHPLLLLDPSVPWNFDRKVST